DHMHSKIWMGVCRGGRAQVGAPELDTGINGRRHEDARTVRTVRTNRTVRTDRENRQQQQQQREAAERAPGLQVALQQRQRQKGHGAGLSGAVGTNVLGTYRQVLSQRPTSMQGSNTSAVTEFILIGFSTFPQLQLMFFLLFLFIPRGCACLVSWSWAGGSILGLVVTATIFHLTFCGPNKVHHFACHVLPLLKLACGADVPMVAIGVGILCITVILGCLLLILLSYAFIVATILKIPSAEGRHKAFSTCASHLTVVVVHYGFASVIYLKPKVPQSLEGDTLMGITYVVLTPFLSPIIFSLRNKELKNAIKKTFLSKLYPEKL
ncbi:Olfactory receptor 10H1, partial [Galemys pyrenaicus]